MLAMETTTMSKKFSSEEWSEIFDDIVLQHSEELGLDDEYGDYLEHKFKIPGLNIEIPDIKLPKINLPKLKIPEKAKSVLSTPISKAKEKISSLAADASKAISTAAAVVKPAKWIWPNGKNSKEYNHWYWETFKDRIKAKRNQTAQARSLNGGSLNGYSKKKPWDELTPKEKADYDDNRLAYEIISFKRSEYYGDLGEMFISQFLTRPMALLSLNIPKYANEVARDILATATYIKVAANNISRALHKGPVDERTGFEMKETDPSARPPLNKGINDDAAQVNPGYRNWNSNTKNNCMLCTATYEMRRRGYDVVAKTTGLGYMDEDFNTWFPNAELKRVTPADVYGTNGPLIYNQVEMLEQQLLQQGSGARGNIMITWQGGLSGHSIAYEVYGNQVILIDAQTNTVYTDPFDLLKYAEGDLRYMRLDNVDFDPEEIKRCCRS